MSHVIHNHNIESYDNFFVLKLLNILLEYKIHAIYIILVYVCINSVL